MEEKERSLFESFLSALSKPGSMGRQLIKENLQGYREKGAYSDIMSGRKEVSPSDLMNFVQDKYGVNLDIGPRDWEEKTGWEQAGTMARDFVVDVATSPDSIIGAPAKFLKGAKLISNPNTIRAATGATLGLLSADADDDATDIVKKVGIGALAGHRLNPAVKAIGRAGRIGGEKLVDGVAEQLYKGSFEKLKNAKIHLGLSESANIARKTPERLKKFSDSYMKEMKEVEQAFVRNLTEHGATDDQIKGSLKMFDETLGEGFSRVVKFRNRFRKAVKTFSDSTPEGAAEHNRIMKDLVAQATRDGGVEEAIEVKNAVTKLGGIAAGVPDEKLFKLATHEASYVYSGFARNKLKDERFGGIVADAIGLHEEANAQLVKQFNRYAKDNDLAKYAFEPVPFHTVDLKEIGDIAKEGKVGAVREGVKARFSDTVESVKEGVSREQAREIGSAKYARLFMNESELQARKVLSTVTKAARESDNKLMTFLKGYDDMLKLQKTIHLTTGTNWLVNNFTDNLIRSFVVSGPSGALQTAGTSLGVGLYVGGNIVTLGGLSKVLKGSLVKELYDAFDPTKAVKNINYEIPWMKAAANNGVVDSDKMQDFYKLAKDNETLLGLTTDAATKKRILEEVKAGVNRSFMPKVVTDAQDSLWGTVGKFGSAQENTARYITFKNVADGMLANDDLARKAIDRVGIENLDEFLLRKPNLMTGNKDLFDGIQRAQKILKKSSAIVKDTFFDYDNVSVFEQQVMKRIFPYWTFMSRNLEFWSRQAFDADTIGRLGVVESVASAGGKVPENRNEIPDYLLEKGARQRGDSIVTIPNLSVIDAAESITSKGFDSIGQKLAPALKTFIQQVTNRDMFTGKSLTPTQSEPKKRVFESAITMLPNDILENLGIYRDGDGKLYTNKEATTRLIDAQRNLFPAPIVLDQAARAKMEVDYRDTDVDDAIIKQISPIKSRQLTTAERLREAKRTQRNIDKLNASGAELLRKKSSSRRRRRRRSRRRR